MRPFVSIFKTQGCGGSCVGDRSCLQQTVKVPFNHPGHLS